MLYLLHKALEAAQSLVLHGAAPQTVKLQGQPLPFSPPKQCGNIHPHDLHRLILPHVALHLPPAGAVQANRRQLAEEREE